jgi:hypothetical protein
VHQADKVGSAAISPEANVLLSKTDRAGPRDSLMVRMVLVHNAKAAVVEEATATTASISMV